MNPKRKGTRNEHRSIKLLESLGYHCIRSAGSLGPFDVVAYNDIGCIFIQCKSNSFPSSIEMEQLKLEPIPPNSVKLVHRWNDRKSTPSVLQIN